MERTAERTAEGSTAPPAREDRPGGTGGEASYPIGALAREAGVSTRTIRYYEEIGLLRTARRFAGGRRVFQGDVLERLRFIGRLKRLGFSLEEISELNEVFALSRSTAEMLSVLDRQLDGHVGAIDRQVEELTRLREDLCTYRGRIRRRLTDGAGQDAAPGGNGR
jgi:DNA-binding transcriptional MerR regulator